MGAATSAAPAMSMVTARRMRDMIAVHAAPGRVPMRPGNDSTPQFVRIEQITTERTG
jgi:hypothetical protein